MDQPYIVFGRNIAMSGNKTRINSAIPMAIQNGKIPLKMSFRGTFGAILLTTKTLTPTGAG